MEGKGVGQWLLRLTPVYLRPQKKSPHGLHHLLGYDRLPSPQTSWAYPSWPRRPDSDKARVPCVAACAARRWRATRCASPARAATQGTAAFDANNTTLTLLGLERQLPRCAFCSLADALEAARHNPLAFLHLANPRTLCLVLQGHGPFGQLAQLDAIVHEGVRHVATLLAVRQLAGNATHAAS